MEAVVARAHGDMAGRTFASVASRSAFFFNDAACDAAYDDNVTDRLVSAILQLAPRMYAALAASQTQGGTDSVTHLARTDRLHGMRVGFVGLDDAHAELAEQLADHFGMSVVCLAGSLNDHARARAHAYDVTEDVDTFLGAADVVVMLSQGCERCHLTMDDATLGTMKPHTIVVSDATALGSDQSALTQVLWFETIAGAVILDDDTSGPVWTEITDAENAVLA